MSEAEIADLLARDLYEDAWRFLGGLGLVRAVAVDRLQHVFGRLVAEKHGGQLTADFHPLGIHVLDAGLVNGAVVRIGGIESGDFIRIDVLHTGEGQGVELRYVVDLVLDVFGLGEESQVLLRFVDMGGTGEDETGRSHGVHVQNLVIAQRHDEEADILRGKVRISIMDFNGEALVGYRHGTFARGDCFGRVGVGVRHVVVAPVSQVRHFLDLLHQLFGGSAVRKAHLVAVQFFCRAGLGVFDGDTQFAEPELMMPSVGDCFIDRDHTVGFDRFADSLELLIAGGNGEVQLFKYLLVIGNCPDGGHVLHGLAVELAGYGGFRGSQGIHRGSPGFAAQIDGVLFNIQLGYDVELAGLGAEQIRTFSFAQLVHQQGGILIRRDDLVVYLDTGLLGKLLSQFHFSILHPVLTGHVGNGNVVRQRGGGQQQHCCQYDGQESLHFFFLLLVVVDFSGITRYNLGEAFV